jgi:hypothetical protein
MTALLKEAVARLLALSESDQDAMASRIIEELEADARWDELFEQRPRVLEQLADEALEEFRKGDTEDLDDLLK